MTLFVYYHQAINNYQPILLMRLEQPLQIKYVPQMTNGRFKDYIALIKWTNYTTDRIITIPKDKILTITNASNEMGTSYYEICKNYQNLDKPKKAAADFYQKKSCLLNKIKS
jgi:hypothetical protein